MNNDNSKYVNFVELKNKWSELNRACYENTRCTNKHTGKCIEGNGYGIIINDENIKYVLKNGGTNKYVCVYIENSFNNPHHCFEYSLYYFEVKCMFEGEFNKGVNHMSIYFDDCNTIYFATEAKIKNEKSEYFKLDNISWNNNDIYGCGVVYPPTNMTNEFPYIFFTQNGKQIGKGIISTKITGSYTPFVEIRCCSIEANFGNNLETNPFKYDISKLSVLKEFY
ncbi:unnamed protein product [Meloidogyne enterolobii]|uniref:Uncharacterized protein n=1 Tax=Meloidogyne enterolobii TaxID=390850 RepID=A0ACB0YXN5_MELEN